MLPANGHTPLVTLRQRLRDLEEAFAADLRAPTWATLPHEERDSRGWEVHNARTALKHAERTARDAVDRARKAADEARRLAGGEEDSEQPGAKRGRPTAKPSAP